MNSPETRPKSRFVYYATEWFSVYGDYNTAIQSAQNELTRNLNLVNEGDWLPIRIRYLHRVLKHLKQAQTNEQTNKETCCSIS